ncbi:hypothetical protein GmRootV15_59040 [Variovorax sp. V15]
MRELAFSQGFGSPAKWRLAAISGVHAQAAGYSPARMSAVGAIAPRAKKTQAVGRVACMEARWLNALNHFALFGASARQSTEGKRKSM